MKTARVCFRTTGCKTNQSDTDDIIEALKDLPAVIVGSDEPADVVVVNACTVTARADRDGRAHIYRALRQTKGTVYLTGCLAVRASPENFCDPRVRVMPETSDRSNLIRALREEIVRIAGQGEDRPNALRTRARPFIKVQDGCSHKCAYCVVPIVRGAPKSTPLEVVVRRVLQEAQKQVAEVVLTGVDLGSWGSDLVPKRRLSDLLWALLELKTGLRFRLSSVEPEYLDNELIDLVAGSSDICPHFHVPVQSGSDRILRAMRRKMSAEETASRITLAASKIRSVTIGLDIICGFPGESDKDFQETFEFIKSLPVTYLHVFPFSPRPGTEASVMHPRVPAKVVFERCARLRDFSAIRRSERARAFQGQKVEVVEIRLSDTQAEGLTAEYFRTIRVGAGEVFQGRKVLSVKATREHVLLVSEP